MTVACVCMNGIRSAWGESGENTECTVLKLEQRTAEQMCWFMLLEQGICICLVSAHSALPHTKHIISFTTSALFSVNILVVSRWFQHVYKCVESCSQWAKVHCYVLTVRGVGWEFGTGLPLHSPSRLHLRERKMKIHSKPAQRFTQIHATSLWPFIIMHLFILASASFSVSGQLRRQVTVHTLVL